MALPGDLTLDRELLRPSDDVLDHRPRGEVLEVQGLFVAVLVRDFEEAVLVVGPVHLGDRLLDHDDNGLFRVAATEEAHIGGIQRQAVK